MPGFDGAAFIRELKQRVGKKMPAVIAAAYDWSDIELEARTAGVGGFISKPLFKSRFIQLFRNVLGDASEHADTESVLGVEEGAFTGKRVLLCEDNALNAEIAVEILNMAGIEVDQAENGREAVEAFNRAAPGRYDLIFMDIQMPVMNGYEATRAIRALPRPDAAQIPIVAMTANAFTEDVEASFRSGMNGHIAKPLDFGQLTETLKKFLS